MFKIKEILKFAICYLSITPFIVGLLCGVVVDTIYFDFTEEDNSQNRYEMGTYNWKDGHYFMAKSYNPNINTEDFCGKEYIYIRNVYGNSPEKVFAKYISSIIKPEKIESRLSIYGYGYNAYGVEGKLIPTDEFCDGIKVFDLYADKVSIISLEVFRENFSKSYYLPLGELAILDTIIFGIDSVNTWDVWLPFYELVILDYRIFSNIYLDFAIILLCSIGLYILLKKIVNKLFSSNCVISNKFVLYYFLIVFSILLFIGFAYLIINILYL